MCAPYPRIKIFKISRPDIIFLMKFSTCYENFAGRKRNIPPTSLKLDNYSWMMTTSTWSPDFFRKLHLVCKLNTTYMNKKITPSIFSIYEMSIWNYLKQDKFNYLSSNTLKNDKIFSKEKNKYGKLFKKVKKKNKSSKKIEARATINMAKNGILTQYRWKKCGKFNFWN